MGRPRARRETSRHGPCLCSARSLIGPSRAWFQSFPCGDSGPGPMPRNAGAENEIERSSDGCRAFSIVPLPVGVGLPRWNQES
jgi:hypothetical protein